MSDAAFWVTRMQASAVTDADYREFEQWLGGDPARATQYNKALQTWRQLTVMRHSPQFGRLLGQPSWRERVVEVWQAPRMPLTLAGAVAVVLLMMSVLFWMSGNGKRYRTEIAQVRTEIFEDGTRATFGADSEVFARYSAGERLIELTKGQVYFDVAKDIHRPFRVIVADKAITALGTAFEVKKAVDVRVMVLEGKVSVVSDASPSAVVLGAGQQTVARINGSVEAPEMISSKEPLSWRAGRMVYENVPLQEIVSDANRYSHQRIVLGDAALGELKVTTSFFAQHVGVLIDTLEGALPVTVERRNDEIVLHSIARK